MNFDIRNDRKVSKESPHTRLFPKNSKEHIRDMFQTLVEDNMDLLHENLGKLEPKDFINAMLALSNFLLPKFGNINVNVETGKEFGGESAEDEEMEDWLKRILMGLKNGTKN